MLERGKAWDATSKSFQQRLMKRALVNFYVENSQPGDADINKHSDSSARTLTYTATVLGGSSNMTVANCVTACGTQNYILAGVEYSGECCIVPRSSLSLDPSS